MYNGQVFVCVQMGTYLIFLQLLLFCEEILLEKYADYAMLFCDKTKFSKD